MFSDMNSFIAIIGDIKDSKKLKERKDIQNRLNQILNEINEKYKEDIASKFQITLGDEFQGLMKNGANVMDIITKIEINIFPIRLRYGIGIGNITTDIDPNIPLGSDGPAYYNARAAMEYLKRNEKRNKAFISNIWICADKKDESTVDLLNTILSLSTVLKSKWTDRQREIIYDYIVHEDKQEGVAKRLGITQSSVQKGLSAGGYYSYEEAISRVARTLADMRRKDV